MKQQNMVICFVRTLVFSIESNLANQTQTLIFGVRSSQQKKTYG